MTNSEQVLQIARQQGVLRAQDVEEKGISSRVLRRLAKQGDLERVGRGLYRHPDAPVSQHHSLALVSARYSGVTVCLLSALQFHELATQMPHRVWIAREKGDWAPEASPARLEVVHMSGPSFKEGVETHQVEGIPVQVFNPAKTVADCFKFRGKVGLSVALEALQDYVRSGTGPIEDLYHYAEICRVHTVMQPYIEATV